MIPTEGLRVTFPWTNASPLVVVNVPGYPSPTCIRPGSGFLSGPLATGVTVQARMRPFIGTGTWTAQFRLRTASPYVALTSLSQP